MHAEVVNKKYYMLRLAKTVNTNTIVLGPWAMAPSIVHTSSAYGLRLCFLGIALVVQHQSEGIGRLTICIYLGNLELDESGTMKSFTCPCLVR